MSERNALPPLIDLADAHGQMIVGLARFTVITPSCIRMEYAGEGAFLDTPTLFAFQREARMADARFRRDDETLTIDTGGICLRYRDDGKPFSEDNLSASISNGDATIHWQPDLKNERNLGGAIPTVDGMFDGIPLPDGLLARDGWHVIDDSGSPVLLDGWIAQAPLNKRPVQDWYLFGYGADYTAALQALTAISGPAPIPRKHVHGSWYCRWFAYTAQDFRAIADEYRRHDFPLDILVMDMDWHTRDAVTGYGHAGTLGWTGYTWNRTLIPDPELLLGELRDDGIFVTLNDHPSDGIREHETCYDDFIDRLGLPAGANPPFNAGDRQYMDAFFQAAHVPLERQGIDFWWLDWQQDYIYPYVYGVPRLRHLSWLNYLYFQHSQRDGRRGQGFSRWGGWGDHRHPIQFSGDSGCTWAMLAFEVSMSATSGNVGCFFWAHDVGGFWGDREPEMYTRWVQFGALSAALRLHSSGDELDRRPWLWGEPFVSAMRKAFHFRAQLFPYIYTGIRQCYDQTLPLLRPMYLAYPLAEESYQYPEQYLLGDHLLVAPITTPGTGPEMTAHKVVWFPAGVWYSLWTGERIAGDALRDVSATLDEIPVYIRGGIPLPMQPYTPRMTTAPLAVLIIRCYPGATGASRLYEDDGQSLAYQQGGFAFTGLHYTSDDYTITVTIGPAIGTYSGQLAERSYRVELPATRPAMRATVNGRPVAVTYDEKQAMNIVTTPPFPITETVVLEIETSELDDK